MLEQLFDGYFMSLPGCIQSLYNARRDRRTRLKKSKRTAAGSANMANLETHFFFVEYGAMVSIVLGVLGRGP